MKDIISDVILALGHSAGVSGLDLTDDDDDGSHVDDFNRDDKGVHHNKEDNPFPLKIRKPYTQPQNPLWTANGTDVPCTGEQDGSSLLWSPRRTSRRPSQHPSQGHE